MTHKSCNTRNTSEIKRDQIDLKKKYFQKGKSIIIRQQKKILISSRLKQKQHEQHEDVASAQQLLDVNICLISFSGLTLHLFTARQHAATLDPEENITSCCCGPKHLPSQPPTCHTCHPCHQSRIQQCAPFFPLISHAAKCPEINRHYYKTTTTTKKKGPAHAYNMYELCNGDHVNHTNKAFFFFFPREIVFTSKFKSTHSHLEEMPSHSPCDLFRHICGQYRPSMWSAQFLLLYLHFGLQEQRQADPVGCWRTPPPCAKKYTWAFRRVAHRK